MTDRIRDAAADWFARWRSDPSGTEAALGSWLAADPRHRVAFDEIAAAWDASAGLAGTALARERKLHRAPFWMRHHTRVVSAMICGLLAISIPTMLVFRTEISGGFAPPAEAATYESGIGQIRTFALKDGTRVTLDTRSRIRFAGTRTQRRLDLIAGRVRVIPARDTRPFVIVTGAHATVIEASAADASIIGGLPTITALGSPVTILPAAGSSGDHADTVKPGEVVDLNSLRVVARVSQQQLQWVAGMLVLDRTPLLQALGAINRYNHVQLQVGDPSDGTRRVTGAFAARDPEGFAEAIAKLFDLRVVRVSPEKIALMPAGKP
jgi:transmembrane sensor